MANEYISKQRAKDLMGCCLASAKANYKEETNIFKREKIQCYVETIEAMIDVVGAVEVADVQPIKHGYWKEEDPRVLKCSVCGEYAPMNYLGQNCIDSRYCPWCGTKMDSNADEPWQSE